VLTIPLSLFLIEMIPPLRHLLHKWELILDRILKITHIPRNPIFNLFISIWRRAPMPEKLSVAYYATRTSSTILGGGRGTKGTGEDIGGGSSPLSCEYWCRESEDSFPAVPYSLPLSLSLSLSLAHTQVFAHVFCHCGSYIMVDGNYFLYK
jgi:hypothetical protein